MTPIYVKLTYYPFDVFITTHFLNLAKHLVNRSHEKDKINNSQETKLDAQISKLQASQN
jgi:hypothetical protein